MAIFKNRRKDDRRQQNDRRNKKTALIVKDVVIDKTGHLSTIKNTATLTECAKVMTFMKVGVLIVLNEQSKFIGTVAERTLVQAMGNHEEAAMNLTVAEIASNEVIACELDTELDVVLDTMKTQGVRHVPVMEDNTVTGVISISDILRHYL